MKILVAVPTYENIYPDTFRSIYRLKNDGHSLDFDFFRGYDVASARNQIAQATLDRGFDYVLMVDNDEVIPEDAIAYLMDGCEGMNVGYCVSRPRNASNTSGRTTAFKFGGKSYVVNDAYTLQELKELCDNNRFKVQIRGTGLGCALISRKVFERMSYPWFKWVLHDDGNQLSEDLFFCEKFREINTPIFVDTRVKCGHMMRHIV